MLLDHARGNSLVKTVVKSDHCEYSTAYRDIILHVQDGWSAPCQDTERTSSGSLPQLRRSGANMVQRKLPRPEVRRYAKETPFSQGDVLTLWNRFNRMDKDGSGQLTLTVWLCVERAVAVSSWIWFQAINWSAQLCCAHLNRGVTTTVVCSGWSCVRAQHTYQAHYCSAVPAVYVASAPFWLHRVYARHCRHIALFTAVVSVQDLLCCLAWKFRPCQCAGCKSRRR